MATQKPINGFTTNLKIKFLSNKKLFIISCIISLFGIPMFIIGKVLEVYYRAEQEINMYYDINLSYGNPDYYFVASIAAICILLVIVLISSFNMFHYLYNRPIVDVIYALPITTKQRFFSDYLAGLLTFIIPYIISAIIAFIINNIAFAMLSEWASATFQSDIGSTSLIFQAFVCVLLILIMMYTLSVLVLTCCGSIVESIGYNIIINIIVPVISVAIFSFFEITIYGFQKSFTTTDFLGKTTVLGAIKMMYDLINDIVYHENLDINSNITLTWALCYITLIAIIFGVTYLLYKKRKAEDVSKPFVFKAVYYIFIMCICFCMSMGIILTSIQTDTLQAAIPWTIFSIIIFLILDTIQNRGFKKIVSGIVKYLIMTASSLLLLMIIIWTNAFGTTFYVPSAEQVEKVTLRHDIDLFSNNTYYYKDSLVFTDIDKINQIIDAQEYVIDEYKTFLDTNPTINEKINYTPSQYTNYMQIIYTLKSGKEVYRAYDVNNNVFIKLKELYLSDENIENIISGLKSYLPEDSKNKYEYIPIYDKLNNEIDSSYISKENYIKLLSAYEQDLKNADINDIINESETYCYIFNHAVLKSYTNTINFLNEIGIKITDEMTIEQFEKYDFSQIDFSLEMTMNLTEIAKMNNTPFISTKMYLDYSYEDLYIIHLNNNYKEKLMQMLIKCEPSYLTEDMNCVFIQINGFNYILPSKYRYLAEEFLASLNDDDYNLSKDYDYNLSKDYYYYD